MKQASFFLLLVFLLIFSCRKSGDEQLQIQLNKTSLKVSGDLNEVDSFTIQSKSAWSIELSPSTATWIRLNAISGSGNSKVIVTAVEKNQTTSSRSVTLLIKPVDASSAQTQKISVIQETLEPRLAVDSATLTINGASGAKDSFTVYSNINWTIASTVSWLNISPVTGNDNGLILVSPKNVNTSGAVRTGIITISPAGSSIVPPKTITVHQLPSETEPARIFDSLLFTSQYTQNLNYFSTNGSMKGPKPLEWVKSNGLLSQVDITFVCDGNSGYYFGFFDPVTRSTDFTRQYYDRFYDSSLASCVKTEFYITKLTKQQFDSARADVRKIGTYFSDNTIMRLSENYYWAFPAGSYHFIETIYPTSIVKTGNIVGFKNVVSGKRGLINIRQDQEYAWPLSTWNTLVDIIVEK